MVSPRIASAFWLIPLAVAVGFAARIVDSSNSRPANTSIPQSPDQQVKKEAIPEKDPSEAAALNSLQAEINALEERVKKREHVLAQRKKEQQPFTDASSLNHKGLDPEQWSNKGYATPYESVETLIFSAASGDLQTMKDSLVFSPESESLAKRLFEKLPNSVRQEQGNLETVMAMMTIDQVPLAHAQITAYKEITDEAKEVFMLFSSNLDSPYSVKLDLIQFPDTTWKVLVPPQAISEYAEKLGVNLENTNFE
ncbi:hypothetical protein [Pelagicoccus sp. SDUM812002]|uniref:hypothetical protein n=1 Tax=Pelagicoccus sp. SDUM812002 TaxID=3041266 RepID=UPI00280DEEDC|nr:hypothetical protein [Pelagicoccus sp. SDUM812002]MDQ8185397.1 hypothetical protein [Pelagicoccus sp. SDUM812002]